MHIIYISCISLTSVGFFAQLFIYLLIQSDFANNEKFITLHIDSSDGKRVYYNSMLIMYGTYTWELNFITFT